MRVKAVMGDSKKLLKMKQLTVINETINSRKILQNFI